MEERPTILTFYSFKGGVGRSMALLNVAYSLVARGRHVLIVDMDIEAPGLSGFLERGGELDKSPQHDILDLLAWARTVALTNPPGVPSEDETPKLPVLTDYSVRVNPKKLDVSGFSPQLGVLGQLHVIRASFATGPSPLAKSYLDRLTQLDLHSLNQNELVRMSSALREAFLNARVQIELPAYYRGEDSEIPFDYVLVDSRTGITEVGGLCVGPLADKVVLFTGLNDQNVQGTKAFAETVGIDLKTGQARTLTMAATDSLFVQPVEGGKQGFLVVSPIPIGELGAKPSRLDEIRKEVGPILATLSYHPQMALTETVFVREYPDEHLAQEYRNLTTRLMESAEDGSAQLIARAQSTIHVWFQTQGAMRSRIRVTVEPTILPLVPKTQHRAKAPPGTVTGTRNLREVVYEILRIAADSPPEVGAQFLEIATSVPPATDQDFFAVDRVFRILDKSDMYERWSVLARWGAMLSSLASGHLDTFGDEICSEARGRFESALRQAPDLPPVSSNLLVAFASALATRAEQKQTTADADPLYEEARQKFEAAAKLQRASPGMLRNWAHSFRDQARYQRGTAADPLFEQAYVKYQEALKLEPDSIGTLWSWAQTLRFDATNKAQSDHTPKDIKKIRDLFLQAGEKFETAAKGAPGTAEILTNWAECLAAQAQIEPPAQAEKTRAEAREKIDKALAMFQAEIAQLTETTGKVEDADLLNHYGEALRTQADLEPTRQSDLRAEARSQFQAAVKIRPNHRFANQNLIKMKLDPGSNSTLQRPD